MYAVGARTTQIELQCLVFPGPREKTLHEFAGRKETLWFILYDIRVGIQHGNEGGMDINRISLEPCRPRWRKTRKLVLRLMRQSSGTKTEPLSKKSARKSSIRAFAYIFGGKQHTFTYNSSQTCAFLLGNL